LKNIFLFLLEVLQFEMCVSLRDHMMNEEIRRRTRITDITERKARLKWQWAGHVAKMDSNRWTSRVLKWRPWDENWVGQ